MLKNIFLLLALLPIIGAGCLKIGPRIVKVPDSPPKETIERVVKQEKKTEKTTTKVVAYVRVQDRVKAEVIRGSSTTSVQDGLELEPGDELLVTEGSISLIYPETGESVIEAPSRIAMLSDEHDEGTVFTEIQLLAGSIWTRFERLFGPDESFSVSANGVVATVRGTAFGVSVFDDDLDIQVADHEIEVTTVDEQTVLETTGTTGLPLKIAAGEGLKLKNIKNVKVNLQDAKKLIRKLENVEKLKNGFLFGLRPIPSERLKPPLKPVRLPYLPYISPEQAQRIYLLRQRQIKESMLQGFVPPVRGVLIQEFAPTGTERQIQGPESSP